MQAKDSPNGRSIAASRHGTLAGRRPSRECVASRVSRQKYIRGRRDSSRQKPRGRQEAECSRCPRVRQRGSAAAASCLYMQRQASECKRQEAGRIPPR